MNELAEPVMNLSKRHRAMLKEMGVQVWQAPPVTALAAPPLEVKAVPVAINSGAARAHIQRATSTFDTSKQAFQAPKTAPVVATEAESASPNVTFSAWRVGKLQTLYAPANPTTGARWLVLLESPSSALQEGFNPFEGDAGKLLDNMLRAAKLHTAGAAMLAPLVRGSDTGGAMPTELANIFATAKADVLLVMGRLAAQALLQSTEPLAKLRGQVHAAHGQQTIITIDPAYLLRNPLDKAKAWDDLCLAISVATSS